MHRSTLLVLCLCLAPVACRPQVTDYHPDQRPQPLTPLEKPPEKPEPVLVLPEPDSELPRDGDRDLEKISLEDLLKGAKDMARDGQYNLAVRYQYWYCQRTKSHRYDLACYHALNGDSNAAFYWLQRAALEDGIDPEYAEEDEDLVSLRRDGRWSTVAPFLRACSAYWATGDKGRISLVLPDKLDANTPVSVLVWFHSAGGSPEDFANDRVCKGLANSLKVAIVGVSGTFAKSKGRYVWSGDPDKDYQRVGIALKEVSERVKIKPGGLIALGFSQGAQVGLEMAVRHPDEYAGAIVLSPVGDFHLAAITPPSNLKQRGFVVTCGTLEAPDTVNLTNDNVGWLHKAKAKVLHKTYANQGRHRLPADLETRLPDWLHMIEEAAQEKTASRES